mgnify:CR=1 FL=1
MSVALGFDYGRARVGVAVGNALTGTARALPALRCPRDEGGWRALGRVVADWHPDVLVVGRPGGPDTPEALLEAIGAFAAELEQRFARPVRWVDESLTSRSAASTLRDARASGAKNWRVRPGEEDSLAAAEIVDQYLRDGG